MDKEYQQIQCRMLEIVMQIASLNQEFDVLKVRQDDILDSIRNGKISKKPPPSEDVPVPTPAFVEVVFAPAEGVLAEDAPQTPMLVPEQMLVPVPADDDEVKIIPEVGYTSDIDVDDDFKVVERKKGSSKEPKKMACWNGTQCPDKDNGCPFNHVLKKEPWEIDCKYGSDCNNVACPFKHEYRPCKYGVDCYRKDECVFDHPDEEPSENEEELREAW